MTTERQPLHIRDLILKEPAFAKASADVSTCPP
jgi:hypothetical protein